VKHSPVVAGLEETHASRLAKTQKQRNSTDATEMNPIGVHASCYDENTRAIPGGRYG
jgi:hypothetical protein